MKSFSNIVAASARYASMTCGALVIVTIIAAPVMAKSPPMGVPEIDPTSVASALALLTGGYFVLSRRIRR